MHNEHHSNLLIYFVYRYFDVAELAAVDWYRMLMKDVEALCQQQVSLSLLSMSDVELNM